MTKFVKSFLNNESGATAIEYGLIAALIAVFCIVAIRGVGTSVKGTFTNISSGLATQ